MREIAIVGRGCLFPGASDPAAFWRNIVARRTEMRPVPAGRWAVPAERAYAPWPPQPDKAYSTVGCYLDHIPHDEALGDLDPAFHLALHVCRQAYASAQMDAVDAGKVGIILGNIALPTDHASNLCRAVLEPLFGRSTTPQGKWLPDDIAPAAMPVVYAAKALGLGGPAFTLDAACASSLYALKLACDELEAGRLDAVLAGGLSRPDCQYTQMGFSQLRALSPSGRASPFGKAADGLVVGEGAGVFVLKRLADAIAHGDTIHGVIRGIGLSNDVAGNLLAPATEGQLRAMRAAYAQAGWQPSDVQLIECHATGTPLGDRTEYESLRELWGDAAGSCAIGSVKGQIGHTLTAAGSAGVLKVLLALEAGQLPPAVGSDDPAVLLDGKPFRALTRCEEWHGPRRAAVSAFGFGGINAHVLIEQYDGQPARHAMPIDEAEPERIAVVAIDLRLGTHAGKQFGIGESSPEIGLAPHPHTKPHVGRPGHFIEEIEATLDRFRIPPTELEQMLPQQLLALHSAADALDSLEGVWPDPLRTAVFVALELDANTTNYHFRWTRPDIERELAGPPLTADRTLGALASIAPSRIARAYRLGGPCHTIQAGEVSSIRAVRLAMAALQRGELDAVVVNAVDLGGDPRATSNADAAATVVLMTLAQAERDGHRILATVDDAYIHVCRELPVNYPGLSPVGDLVNIALAAQALDQQCLPERPQIRHWIHDRDGGPRRVWTGRFTLTEHPRTAELPPRGWNYKHPFLCAGQTIPDLIDTARAALDLPQPKHITHGHGLVRAAVIGCDIDEALRDLQEGRPNPNLVTSSLTERGKLAFLFPGSGNVFPGMGRTLGYVFPAILQRQHAENAQLRTQYRPDLFWDEPPYRRPFTSECIFGQVSFATLACDLLAAFGVKPDMALGLSLGQSASLFGLRAWRGRDEMLGRLEHSTLFTTELGGECNAARRYWNLLPNEDVNWITGVLGCPAERVRSMLPAFPHVYLQIRLTPTECVIGGQYEQVLALAELAEAAFVRLSGVTIAHCPIVEEVRQAYRDLHTLPGTPPAGVQWYSEATGEPYTVTTDSAADAVLNQALGEIDYVRAIERLYADGARIFLEVGPGASCCRAVGQILGDRPHVAIALAPPFSDPLDALMRLLARLHVEGVDIDLSPMDWGPTKQAYRVLRIPVPAVPFVIQKQNDDLAPLSPRPCGGRGDGGEGGLCVAVGNEVSVPLSEFNRSSELFSLSESPLTHIPSPPAEPGGEGGKNVIPAFADAQVALMQAHETYLRFAAGTHSALTSLFTSQANILQQTLDQPYIVGPAPSDEPPRSLNRDQCVAFAAGQIGPVLGPRYAAIDAFPTRVRLPDGPLMLVDRILRIDGEPLSLSHGRIVTEHDVTADRWYLDHGRIPTCVAVESGQADLFLAGFLGIDFHTHGLAVYRLLDAVVTFHRALPVPGDTIRYDIRIVNFFRQGDTHLFRFAFEATVDGEPLMSMREGCAGFFTQAELDAGKGIVQTSLQTRPMPGRVTGDWQPLVPFTDVEAYSEEQVEALRTGDLAGCFGPAFAGLPLRQPTQLPGGMLRLVHRVTELDPRGGRFGLGRIRAEADIHPDDWFLTCHFIDDQVMPGTLMYECCLHTLRVFLLRSGWVCEDEETVCEPVPGVSGQLKCRGQVVGSTRVVMYEVTVKEIGYRPEPYAVVDALMYADGKPIVEITGMSLRMTGLTRERFEAIWSGRSYPPLSLAGGGGMVVREQSDVSPPRQQGTSQDPCWRGGLTSNSPHPHPPSKPGAKGARSPLYGPESIRAFAVGNPSEAFGEPYRVFDRERIIARLPGPPYQFLDRAMSVDCPPWVLQAGGSVETEYDVPANEWYFAADRQPAMPFAVLLEVALQPCGWLAAYLGSALTSDTDLSFRNLGGRAVQHRAVLSDGETLAVRVKITRVSQSVGMIIQHYDFAVRDAVGRPVYDGDTYFGFFSKAALANQVGIREPIPFAPPADDLAQAERFAFPREAPFPDDRWRMVDDIAAFLPDGGPDRLGWIRGTQAVDPSAWYFAAHFHQDPVMPGSLGLEAFVQLLKVVAGRRWGVTADTTWQALALGEEQRWVYRGQVVPRDNRVTVEASVRKIDEGSRRLWADGFLSVDGRVIYQMTGFCIEQHG